MGQRYVRLFRTSAKVYGCDVRTETHPDGVRCFETVTQLLAKVTPTIVVIALPADQHLPTLYAVRKAHPDCSVLLEKPVTDKVIADIDIVRCYALGGVIAVGYCWRFHPYVRELYAERDGIRDITLHVASDMRTWPGQRYADPLREFSHELDLVTHLTSNPTLTSAEQVHGGYVITGTHRLGIWRVHIEPYRDPPARWISLRMAGGATLMKHWEKHESWIDAMYRAQAMEVQGANDQRDLTCPLRDALRTTVLVDEVEQALNAQNTEVLM
jgi:predicted dehydrogenase